MTLKDLNLEKSILRLFVDAEKVIEILVDLDIKGDLKHDIPRAVWRHIDMQELELQANQNYKRRQQIENQFEKGRSYLRKTYSSLDD